MDHRLGGALGEPSPSPEPQLQLLGHAQLLALERRRARPEAMLGEQPRDLSAHRDDLGPAHRTRAARAGLDIGLEHDPGKSPTGDMGQHPCPSFTLHRRVVLLAK